MRDDRLRLEDVLEAIAKIRQYTNGQRDAFFIDEMLQVWVLHHIQMMGEALASLSPELREANRSWARGVTAMRNVLVHQYFGIDLALVWQVVEHDLDILEARVQTLLDTLTD